MTRGVSLKEWLIMFVVLVGIAFGLVLAAGGAGHSGIPALSQGAFVYWTDGDSGRLADGTRFRLHGVDAPETGSIKWYAGAKCEHERELGFAAKARLLELTRGKTLTVTRDYGQDSYGRLVVDIAVDGQDLGDLLVRAGTHKVWDYDGGEPKPDWCTQRTPEPVARS